MIKSPSPEITIVGGGLAGSEAAWQCARRKIHVKLFEMRPGKTTGAHNSSNLAELVCSNSLGSKQTDHASGQLMSELRSLESLLLNCAERTALPAGSALAVDRDQFAELVTESISKNPYIELVRDEILEIPQGITIIATGPLTSNQLAQNIGALTGEDYLYFYDALAPIVSHDSIDPEISFRASRYGMDHDYPGDYINCPLNKDEYDHFIDELIHAERIQLQSFESEIDSGVKAGESHFFEGCLPIEILARRGIQALAYGPMRPVGLTPPDSSELPYAVVQLRQDNKEGSLYNIVGFQTNLTYAEQKRVFRLIPGLRKAEFMRYGQMHRNTFIASPALLYPTLQYKEIPDLLFAGQIIGVEGYLGNIATGLLAGLNASRIFSDQVPLTLPGTTMLGALCQTVTHTDIRHFQPVKANFGILPPLSTIKKTQRIGKRERALLYIKRAREDLTNYMQQISEI